MTEDTLLAERLAPLVDAPAAPDWGDVTRRVRRARRRRRGCGRRACLRARAIRDRLAQRRPGSGPRPARFRAARGGGAEGDGPGDRSERRAEGDRGDAL